MKRLGWTPWNQALSNREEKPGELTAWTLVLRGKKGPPPSKHHSLIIIETATTPGERSFQHGSRLLIHTLLMDGRSLVVMQQAETLFISQRPSDPSGSTPVWKFHIACHLHNLPEATIKPTPSNRRLDPIGKSMILDGVVTSSSQESMSVSYTHLTLPTILLV